MDNVLDLNPKILDNIIKELILRFDGLSPEEQFILLEDYKERNDISYDLVRNV